LSKESILVNNHDAQKIKKSKNPPENLSVFAESFMKTINSLLNKSKSQRTDQRTFCLLPILFMKTVNSLRFLKEQEPVGFLFQRIETSDPLILKYLKNQNWWFL
jgi:hypothetical protein